MSNTVEMKYYCPLKVLVYEENEYGDIDESDSYELDGRFADSYEYEIHRAWDRRSPYTRLRNGADKIFSNPRRRIGQALADISFSLQNNRIFIFFDKNSV